jgi:type IV pilus assembly protein PilW
MDHTKSIRQEAGMTLVEVMIAMSITIIILAAAFTTLIVTEKMTRANDKVVETQQNVRTAMDILARDIKFAGYGMNGPVGNNCRVGRVATNNAAALVPWDKVPGGPDNGPDEISLATAVGSFGGTPWRLASAVGTTGTGFNQITLNSGAVAEMQNQAGGVLNGAFVTVAGLATGTVLSTSGDTITFTQPISPPASFGVGASAYLLQCVTYTIGNTTAACAGGNAPCLRRNGVPITDGVEDIQFEYACDGCVATINGGIPDGIIDNQGGAAGYDALDFVSNNAWNLGSMLPDKIRLVKIFVVTRQLTADQGTGEARTPGTLTAGPLTVSDHQHALGVFTAGDYAGLTPPYTTYRRRVLTRTVELRVTG